MKEEEIKKIVREGYAKIARGEIPCCGYVDGEEKGYTKEESASTPGEAVSLGCGNPVAIASLREGETVVDLGSGAGLDCFLAARKVGEKGKVIGVDMTPEMIEKAWENCRKGGFKNVEFKLGEIENLPIADNSVDVVISNCVINLSPDKGRVFKEAFRVLKPGGRLIVSDIVLLEDILESLKWDIEAYIGCVAGAVKKEEYLALIRDAGFKEVKVIEEACFSCGCGSCGSTASIASITAYGVKPR